MTNGNDASNMKFGSKKDGVNGNMGFIISTNINTSTSIFFLVDQRVGKVET
jgi:hypothetical protein